MIQTFRDVENEIRRLRNELDQFRSRNIDLTQRRVVNAHPSVDPYDYVVRKELNDIQAAGIGDGGGVGGIDGDFRNYLRSTWGIGVGYPVALSNAATPPYICTVQGSAIPRVVYIAALTPPTGQDLIVDLILTGFSIFGTTKLHLPAGAVMGTIYYYTNIFRTTPPLTLTNNSVIACQVLQVGSIIAGQDIEIVLLSKLNE